MSDEAGNKAAREEERQRMREGVLRILLTSAARERLTNIRMVKPDLAKLVEDNIIRLASTGKIKPPVTDEDVKKILMAAQPPRREFRIRWA